MSMKRDDYGSDVVRSLAMITQFGINMIVPILMCGGLGLLLDRHFSTSWISIAGFFIGALAGFRNIFVFSKKIYEGKSETRRQRNRRLRRSEAAREDGGSTEHSR